MESLQKIFWYSVYESFIKEIEDMDSISFRYPMKKMSFFLDCINEQAIIMLDEKQTNF